MKIVVIGGGPAGLYLALLARKARPSCEVIVHEKNPPGVTWGWGVVFSDETLERFQEADRESYEAITGSFARWDAIDVHFGGRVIRSGGHAFAGLRRMRLLEILQGRCRDLGVDLRFESDGGLPADHPDADLIVAADGIHSAVRTHLADRFHPDVSVGRSPYIWLATTRVFEAFTFIVRENHHGLFTVHAYPFDATTSTFIVETDERTWRRAGLDAADEARSLAYCERLFEPELDGNALLGNKSSWIKFRHVRCSTWHDGNVVLIGDAAHTAHFSIGSGTKLAMEDAIALSRALAEHDDVPSALHAYQHDRWVDVAKRQRVAGVSQRWFEEIRRYKGFDPEGFAFSLLSRSRKVTHANLKKRDPAYVESVDRWFAARAGVPADPGEPPSPPPPPMFTPFRVGSLTLANRVVVSPMCMYSAVDGTVNDWHLVHLGSRAVGGAGLVISEMTDVSADGRITPGCAGIYRDEHVAAWRRITDFVHANSDAKIGMQLAHAGRKGSCKLPWEGTDAPLETGGWPVIAPSAIPWMPGHPVPREMTRADMAHVREDFAKAARRAEEAGFDLVELHAAHGYLLASFLSPLTNHRHDAYGGPIENRLRFPLEVLDAVRDVWPSTRPVAVRLSASDWVPGGFDPDQAIEAAGRMKEHGCDIVDVSSAWTTPDSVPRFGSLYQLSFSDRVRNEARVPTMTVGNVQSWDQINTILAAGYADLCVLARPHLADPYFTLHAAAAQGWDVRWPNQYLAAKPRRHGGEG